MEESTDTAYSEIIERMKAGGRLKNDSAVARALGVTPQALSNYKKRGRMPSHLVIKFASIYGFSVDWLLSGSGDAIRNDALTSLNMGGTGYSFARESSDTYAGDGYKSITPEELISVGKLLRIMRESDETALAAIKYSIDAFTTTLNSKKSDDDLPTLPPKDRVRFIDDVKDN